jgi:hypothetical protein
MPVDEQATDSSTVLDEAQDQSLAEKDFERYKAVEDARERAIKTGANPEVPPASKTSDPAAASDPANKNAQERKPKTGEDRKAELAAEIKELLKQRAELQGKTEAPGVKVAEPPPADKPPVIEKPEAKGKAPVKPELPAFATWAEYDAARDVYVDELVAFRAKEALAADKAEQKVADVNRALEAGVQKSIAEGRKKYADFDEVALNARTPISKAMDGFILDSDLREEVLYRLGENESAEAKRIFALPVYKQVRALVEIEREFAAAPEKKPTAPVKKHTEAPPPATELGGRASEPSDPVANALARGDFAAYQRLANARDAKAKTG